MRVSQIVVQRTESMRIKSVTSHDMADANQSVAINILLHYECTVCAHIMALVRDRITPALNSKIIQMP